jgi:hypothetical protein
LAAANASAIHLNQPLIYQPVRRRLPHFMCKSLVFCRTTVHSFQMTADVGICNTQTLSKLSMVSERMRV